MAVAERMPEVGRRFYNNVIALTIARLAAYLKARNIERVFLAGLATAFCLAWTALDARTDPDFFIIARTDARAVEGDCARARTLGAGDSAARLLDRRVCRLAHARGRRGRVGLALGRLHEDVVQREVEKGRAAVRGPRREQRVVDEPLNLIGAFRRRRQLRERAHERHVVDLLQRALAPAERRRAPAEHDHQQSGDELGTGP